MENTIDNTDARPAHYLPLGTILNQKYRIADVLGEGGFGITYKGQDMTLEIPVAIKEYYPHGYANRSVENSLKVTLVTGNGSNYYQKGKEKFLYEARTLAKFTNIPGIVAVRDFFEENDTAYIVMEYLEGISLKKLVMKNGPFSMEKICHLMLPLLQSLYQIHNKELIHRDISPDNIMYMPDGTLKLYDFGAARNVSGQDQRSLSVILKPGFAPEEQYRSKGIQGAWTDVYAICATIYYCITGKTPDESVQRVFNDEIKKPSELGVKIPSWQEDALMKGLSLIAKDRYQDVLSLAQALTGIPTSSNSSQIQNEAYNQSPIETIPINSEQRKESLAIIPEEQCTQLIETEIKDKTLDNLAETPSNTAKPQPLNRKFGKKQMLTFLFSGAGVVVCIILLFLLLPSSKQDETNASSNLVETKKIESSLGEVPLTSNGSADFRLTDLKATKATELMATFSSTVDTSDITLSLTKDDGTTVANTVTWNTNKTIATITTSNKITAGIYILTATSASANNGSFQEIVIEDQIASSDTDSKETIIEENQVSTTDINSQEDAVENQVSTQDTDSQKDVPEIQTSNKDTSSQETIIKNQSSTKDTNSQKTVTENPYVKSINILDDIALTGKGTINGNANTADALAYVYYQVLDQNGKDLTDTTTIQWSASCTIVSDRSDLGRLTLKRTDDKAFTDGELIYVTGVYTKTGLSVQKTLTVSGTQKNANPQEIMVEDQPVTETEYLSIEILNDIALTDDNQTVAYVYYQILNQNGKDLTDTTTIQWSSDCTIVSDRSDLGRLTLKKRMTKFSNMGNRFL